MKLPPINLQSAMPNPNDWELQLQPAPRHRRTKFSATFCTPDTFQVCPVIEAHPPQHARRYAASRKTRKSVAAFEARLAALPKPLPGHGESDGPESKGSVCKESWELEHTTIAETDALLSRREELSAQAASATDDNTHDPLPRRRATRSSRTPARDIATSMHANMRQVKPDGWNDGGKGLVPRSFVAPPPESVIFGALPCKSFTGLSGAKTLVEHEAPVREAAVHYNFDLPLQDDVRQILQKSYHRKQHERSKRSRRLAHRTGIEPRP